MMPKILLSLDDEEFELAVQALSHAPGTEHEKEVLDRVARMLGDGVVEEE